VTSLGNMAHASKPSYFGWQGTFFPPTANMQLHYHAEQTSCFIPIFLGVSFSLTHISDRGFWHKFLCRILGFHSGSYEHCHLLGYSAV
jgi:hypothetical protein